MRNSEEINSYNDAAMRIILQPLVEDELKRFDENNKRPHEYSAEFKRNVQKLFRNAEIRDAARVAAVWGRRIAACVMIILTVVLASCAVIKPLREKIAGAIVEWFEEYVAVYFEDDSTEPLMREPRYVPEGYAVVSDVALDDYRAIRYANEAVELITFICEPNNEDAALFDSEQHEIENVKIGKSEGIFFKDAAGTDNMISWATDGYIYHVIGNVSCNELVHIAEEVQ